MRGFKLGPQLARQYLPYGALMNNRTINNIGTVTSTATKPSDNSSEDPTFNFPGIVNDLSVINKL